MKKISKKSKILNIAPVHDENSFISSSSSVKEVERSFNRDDFESTKVPKKKSVKKEKETKKLSKKELKLLEIKRELERVGEEGEEEMKDGKRRESFDHEYANTRRNKNGLVHGMYEDEDFKCSQGESSLIDSDGEGDGEGEGEGDVDRGGIEMRTHWVAGVRGDNCRDDGSCSSSSNTNLNISNISISSNGGGIGLEGVKGQKRRIRKKLDENEVSPHVQVREVREGRVLNSQASKIKSNSFSLNLDTLCDCQHPYE